MAGPRNARTTSRGRTYLWRDEQFDSVTTILSGGVPKPALTNWAAKSVAEYVAANLAEVNAIASKDTAAAIDLMKGSPWRQSSAAAVQGSAIHAWAEAHVLGQTPPPAPAAHQPYLDGFLRFIDEWQPAYEMSEATVYSRKYGYAGTLDAIADLADGLRWLLDIKTGADVWPEAALQLAAYRHAPELAVYDEAGQLVAAESMPAVERCGVVHLIGDGTYRLVPVVADRREFDAFMAARALWQWNAKHAKGCLGSPMVREEVAA